MAELFVKVQKVYDGLWNGKYYNYDSSKSMHRDSIMADMLAGQWYARACGTSVLDKDRVVSSLSTIYDFNISKFKDGKMGAVNGMRPNGLRRHVLHAVA